MSIMALPGTEKMDSPAAARVFKGSAPECNMNLAGVEKPPHSRVGHCLFSAQCCVALKSVEQLLLLYLDVEKNRMQTKQLVVLLTAAGTASAATNTIPAVVDQRQLGEADQRDLVGCRRRSQLLHSLLRICSLCACGYGSCIRIRFSRRRICHEMLWSVECEKDE